MEPQNMNPTDELVEAQEIETQEPAQVQPAQIEPSAVEAAPPVQQTAMPEPAVVPPPVASLLPSPSVAASQVNASECADGSCGAAPSLVYALGQVGYDFGTEARRDSFVQHGVDNPYDPEALLGHLKEHAAHATALTWTLSQDATAIYAIQPAGPFAADIYAALGEFLDSQMNEGVERRWRGGGEEVERRWRGGGEGVERVSIPGWIHGSAALMNGQTVPVIVPELRGMYSWSTPALVAAAVGEAPKAKGRPRRPRREGDRRSSTRPSASRRRG